MLDKIKFIFKRTNLIITIPIIAIIVLVMGNGYLIYQNQQLKTKITKQNQEITKISDEFAVKYKKVEKQAKQEFKATHADPLNQS